MELATCREFAKNRPARDWISPDQSEMLSPSDIVLPVEVELHYKVVG